jgi:hypothetical protein
VPVANTTQKNAFDCCFNDECSIIILKIAETDNGIEAAGNFCQEMMLVHIAIFIGRRTSEAICTFTIAAGRVLGRSPVACADCFAALAMTIEFAWPD